MQDLVRQEGVDECIFSITYRPFDTRYIWYHRQAIERGDARWPVMKHVLPDGVSLITSRQSTNKDFTSVFVARGLSEMKAAESSRGSYAFPVLIRDEQCILYSENGHSNIHSQRLAPHLQGTNPTEVWGRVIGCAKARVKQENQSRNNFFMPLASRVSRASPWV